MFGLAEKIIIFDTEYTTWEGAMERKWSGPGEYKEIVEIGAVLVETEDFSELDTFSVYVKPVKNPKLSELFINLTGISQRTVDEKGIGFPEALQRFFAWSGAHDLYCYGHDGEVLEGNAELITIPFPFERLRFHNIKELFKHHGIPADNYMSSTIVRAFGKEPSRRGHSALNDARTILDGLRLLKEKVASRT